MTSDRRRVAVFASTRADLFPLAPVLAALAACPDLAVTLLASGTLANRRFGDPLGDVPLAGVDVEWVAAGLDTSGYAALTEGGARISAELPRVLDRIRPDACVVLGDRWELLYAVPAMTLLGVPVVHLHGGEVTEGAVDDRVRHAVTKLADLHCVSTEAAAARVRQLGEPADRITVTGAPSLDRVATTESASDALLGTYVGVPVRRPLALVTYHPSTVATEDVGAGARAVLEAAASSASAVLVTHPGLDRGREAVMAAVAEAVRRHPHVHEVEMLGADYLSVLAAVDVVVGNSSSGILEAATFGVPVVNVGDRQRGRVSGDNVVDVPEDQAAIEAAIGRCLAPDFRERARRAVNVYGDGKAAPRVVEVVRRAVRGGLARKPFVDLPAQADR